MSKKKKQQSLKALQKKWYKKLEKSGFKDIEDANGNLRMYAGSIQYNYPVDVFTSKQRYFELAGQLVHSGYLTNSRDLDIWRLHAEGKTAVEIYKKVGVSIKTVRETINDIQRRYIKSTPR